MTRPLHLGRIARSVGFGALAVTSIAAIASGCLDRPVAPATPAVSARVVERAKQNKVAKIDLLFMIDNSSSMADKQSILADVVPDLVNRLVNPVCVDPKTLAKVGDRDATTGKCKVGEPDFQAVEDIHIGIVSSSLGSHGAPPPTCDDATDTTHGRADPHNNDKGHLITRGGQGIARGFLSFSGGGVDAINTTFTSMVKGVGQHGCGYEAQLESIYRFLIEPDPFDSISIKEDANHNQYASLDGRDEALLTQRADFLRPDSLVSVIAVTDENDCSIVDGGQNYVAILPSYQQAGKPAETALSHGTEACLTNPNDHCCFNCGQSPYPSDCPAPSGDKECMKGHLLKTDDPENLRCYNQKQRYGVDFLYGVQRYIDGFTSSKIANRGGALVPNPLFSDLSTDCTKNKTCATERDKSLVFFAGIVGVPWQDITRGGTDISKGFMTAKELDDGKVWDIILGNPSNPSGPVAPTDKHMIESVLPRQGLPGITAAANADPIHGHEWDPSKLTRSPSSDLQYACVFNLPEGSTKTCAMGGQDCDCAPEDVAAGINNPLCTGAATQSRAKGYPGIRELQVLQGLKDQAIVASICPANLDKSKADTYGYQPAIAALISRLRNALRGRCLPRQLQPDELGAVPCVIIEAFSPDDGKCDCTGDPKYKGREAIPSNSDLLTDDVKSQGTCFCKIIQLDGQDRTACQTQAAPNVADGWCYVDPTFNGAAACDIVQSCAATEKRIIRFATPTSEPRGKATAIIMCQEASFPSNGEGAPVDVCPATKM